jgi:hypothetical protein
LIAQKKLYLVPMRRFTAIKHPTQGVALGYNIAPLWGFKMPNLMAVVRRLGTRKLNHENSHAVFFPLTIDLQVNNFRRTGSPSRTASPDAGN